MKTVKDYEYSFNHVNKRLRERYKIKSLTKSEYKNMNKTAELMRNPEKALWIDNNRDQEVYEWMMLDNSGKYVKVKLVWSNSKERITTVLKK